MSLTLAPQKPNVQPGIEPQYKRGQFKVSCKQALAAVPGSKGIISEIARRLGVARLTVYRYMEEWATFRQAIEDERAALIDLAETVVMSNIDAARAQQEADPTAIVDSSDAKWVLTKLAKDRYGDRAELEIGELTVTVGFKAAETEQAARKPATARKPAEVEADGDA